MYAETDFLLALIKDEDWLGEAAESVYEEHEDDLWTSKFSLIELLMVAYREGLDAESVVTNAANLLDVRGAVDEVVAAATYVQDYDFTPFDALHLVAADGDTIVSSDDTYDAVTDRLDLRKVSEE